MLYKEKLSIEEETYYLKKIQQNDVEARNKIIEHNLRLVFHISKKFKNSTIDDEELVGFGTIGLIKGIDSYNHKRGVKLSTYISKCIENEILMQLRKEKHIISVNNQTSINNEILLDDRTFKISDILADNYDLEEEFINKDNSRYIKQTIFTLDEEERKILIYYLYKNKTQAEISILLNVTQSYISKKLNGIYKKLKPYFEDSELNPLQMKKLSDAKTKILNKSFKI